MAAFYAQPVDEDDSAPLAAFDWSLLADEVPAQDPLRFQGDDRRIDAETAAALDKAVSVAYEQGYRDALAAQPGGPTNMPDSDNYLGEFGVAELLAEVVRRPSHAGDLVAVLIRDSDGRLVQMPVQS